jgi:uncharacterized membrane protein
MHATLYAALIAPFLHNPLPSALVAAGVALFLIGAWSARAEIAQARGPYHLEKVVALRHLCMAIPLAVFGALHLWGPQFIAPLVPRYMPWRSFWVYGIGVALIAAALSIATRICVRWSGFLFGIMMFLFVAMIHFRGALAQPHNRIIWTVCFREMSFGGAGWLLAGVAATKVAIAGAGESSKGVLIMVGRVVVAIATLVFGVLHFLHPLGLPGVPLEKQMPAWVPGREVIDYLTGAALVVAGASILFNRKTRIVCACVGALLLLLAIYAPVLLGALSQPGLGVEIEGINYFADTLLHKAISPQPVPLPAPTESELASTGNPAVLTYTDP